MKFFIRVLLRFGNSLKLNFKSYFLQFVLCQYVKDLLDLYSPRGDSGIEPGLQPFLLYMLNRFAYKKLWVLIKPTSYFFDVYLSFHSFFTSDMSSLQKGGVPAAPSGTATLLRLSPNYQFHLRPPLAVTDFRCPRLSWLDGRCVQGPGTYSPRHG